MKAITWHGKHDMRCEHVPDPRIEHGRHLEITRFVGDVVVAEKVVFGLGEIAKQARELRCIQRAASGVALERARRAR